MKVLVAGGGGLLGSAFRRGLSIGDVAILGRSDLDIQNVRKIQEIIQDLRPDVLINCAAHTDLDAAELDSSLAVPVNTILPGILAVACRRLGIPIVQISSTGCYGSWKETPYTEDDRLRPLTVHHRSKKAGEIEVLKSGAEHLIIRTGWLYGGNVDQSKNFVWRRLIEALGKTRLTSDVRQRGTPTSVDDVVAQVHCLLENGIRGTFNVTAQGVASRFEYVSRIVARAHLPCAVEAGPAFARSAPVSNNEAALNTRLQAYALDQMPHWETALDRYVDALVRTPEWDQMKDQAQ